ncbi:MAG: hypothetical protein ACI84D_001809 [Thalassolituus oleivorans]
MTLPVDKSASRTICPPLPGGWGPTPYAPAAGASGVERGAALQARQDRVQLVPEFGGCLSKGPFSPGPFAYESLVFRVEVPVPHDTVSQDFQDHPFHFIRILSLRAYEGRPVIERR